LFFIAHKLQDLGGMNMSILTSKKTKNQDRKYTKGLRGELDKLASAGETGNLNIALNAVGLPRKDADIVRLINKAMENYRDAIEYDLMKYRLTSDALGVALWDMDVVGGDPVNPNNKFTWSQEFRHMLGFSDERDFPNITSSWSDRLHPDDKDRTINAFAAHLTDHSGNTPYDLTYRLMIKNGEYRNFHAFGATLRDKMGLPLRVAGALEDITEKSKMHSELETNDLRFKLLLKSIDIALWDMVVDTNDPVGGNNEFWWSDEFRHMLGFTGEHDFPNVLHSWSDRLHPEDKAKTLNAFAAHITDYTGRTPYNIRYRLQHKNGDYLLIKADGTTLRSPSGVPIRVVGSVEDITYDLNKDTLSDHFKEFTEEINSITQIIAKIRTVIESLKEAQEQNLLTSAESEKNTAETQSIISTIQNIAFQTNILALNASVEAARAGQHGKGFSVVADEVRNLASKSAESASQIETKLKAIHDSSELIVNDIKNTAGLVDEQAEMSVGIKDTIDRLVSTYNNLTNMISRSTNK